MNDLITFRNITSGENHRVTLGAVVMNVLLNYMGNENISIYSS